MQNSQETAQTSKCEAATVHAVPDSPYARLVPLEAEQACNECRRRKAKCNKVTPTCGPCARFRRRCVYEKLVRSPLTRKHLTEVEQRLEKAEELLRRSGVVSSQTPWRDLQSPEDEMQSPLDNGSNNSAFAQGTVSASILQPQANLRTPVPEPDPIMVDQLMPTNYIETRAAFSTFDLETLELPYDFPAIEPDISIASRPSTALERKGHPSDTLDAPPATSDNFEWDEQNSAIVDPSVSGSSPHTDTVPRKANESEIADGMASLTIDDSRGGYLGVASGAALLRAINQQAVENIAHQRSGTNLHARTSSLANRMRPQLIYLELDVNRHVVDNMIDAYFQLYNVSYPIVHEPIFRAQYSELVERPNGDSWLFLAYIVAAIGVFTTSTAVENTDAPLFAHAKSLMHSGCLESGNLTLIQALALMSNYLQKKDMPNSSYNYLGLATRMAIGIGLHKEFHGWNISPLRMETRRRVWWCLSVFDIGATITFGRPIIWPGGGIDVALPLNIHDRQLTAASKQSPAPSLDITIYSALQAHAALYLAAMPVYSRIISKPFPSAEELINMDDQTINDWHSKFPTFFADDSYVPQKFQTSHAVINWKYRNFRIIMYRPFVIRKALYPESTGHDTPHAASQAYSRCLFEARATIMSIQGFWSSGERTRMAAWYALYFLFQAVLIPCICLRNDPTSPDADEWRWQVQATLDVIESLSAMNPNGKRCHEVVWGLCGKYLSVPCSPSAAMDPNARGTTESPQTAMRNVYSMLWTNISTVGGEMTLENDAWMADLVDGDRPPGFTE